MIHSQIKHIKISMKRGESLKALTGHGHEQCFYGAMTFDQRLEEREGSLGPRKKRQRASLENRRTRDNIQRHEEIRHI